MRSSCRRLLRSIATSSAKVGCKGFVSAPAAQGTHRYMITVLRVGCLMAAGSCRRTIRYLYRHLFATSLARCFVCFQCSDLTHNRRLPDQCSCLTNLLSAVETVVADSVQLAKSSPILLQLSERQWGASATLPLDTVPGECCIMLAG